MAAARLQLVIIIVVAAAGGGSAAVVIGDGGKVNVFLSIARLCLFLRRCCGMSSEHADGSSVKGEYY